MVLKKAGQAILNIHLYNTNNRITLLVSDNGTQNEPFTSHTEESGYGLENIKQRFQLFFQEQTTFSFLSTKENGTTVEITWPFITEKHRGGNTKMNVLLVDDEPLELEQLEFLIHRQFPNWTLHLALDAAEALSINEKFSIHLALLDIHLPHIRPTTR